MYIRTPERLGLGLGFPPPPPKSQHEWQKPTLPQPALQETFTSSVIVYKDKDGSDKCQSTNCSIYVPSALRNQPQIDMLVFFHGLDTCMPKHNFDPALVVKNFRLDDQVDKAARKVALAVPIVWWGAFGTKDRLLRVMNIRTAWSAANLNAFVEEVLSEIGKFGVRPKLGHLILAGHSGAYDILTPLADQYDCRVAEATKGALAKLRKVLAMDTTYGLQHAKALEKWAHNRGDVQFRLVLGNSVKPGEPPTVWQSWMNTRGKGKFPGNLTVLKTNDGHCVLPSNYVKSFLDLP